MQLHAFYVKGFLDPVLILSELFRIGNVKTLLGLPQHIMNEF